MTLYTWESPLESSQINKALPVIATPPPNPFPYHNNSIPHSLHHLHRYDLLLSNLHPSLFTSIIIISISASFQSKKYLIVRSVISPSACDQLGFLRISLMLVRLARSLRRCSKYFTPLRSFLHITLLKATSLHGNTAFIPSSSSFIVLGPATRGLTNSFSHSLPGNHPSR